jgi:protein-arginine kinase activator protein McsA
MKPKTKLQKRVDELSGFLPQLLTASQQSYAFDKCFDHYGFKNSGNVHCMDCGSTFKTVNELGPVKCPECKIQIIVTETKR